MPQNRLSWESLSGCGDPLYPEYSKVPSLLLALDSFPSGLLPASGPWCQEGKALSQENVTPPHPQAVVT